MARNILLIFALTVALENQVNAAQLDQAIARCAAEQDSLKRLVCYDQAAEKHNLRSEVTYVEPDPKFLSSRLVAVPWETEYNLSISQFVNLISSAVLEDGTKVKVKGWTKNNNRYVLNIVMRAPVQLSFLPGNKKNQNGNLSLLEPVEVRGKITDASQFILVIATMVPDKQK